MRKHTQESRHPEKPHICFVSETKATYDILTGKGSATGGAEVQQMLVSLELMKLGYAVTFLVPDCGQQSEFITENGIRVIKTRPQYRSAHWPHHYLVDIGRIFKAMRRSKADIFYQRAAATITGIAALYCRLNCKPFIFSIAHNKDVDGTGRLLLKSWHRWLYDFGLRNATAVVAQTNDQMRMLKENHGMDGFLIRSTFLSSGTTHRPKKGQYILWVSGLRAMKRPDMFVELAGRLPEYKFVMVGGSTIGAESLYKDIEKKAANVSNLEMTGAVPYNEVGEYF